MSRRLVEIAARVLAARTDRRGFLVKAAVAGSAIAVDPLQFALHPVSAYGYVCRCGNPRCRCGSPCCDGYTEFCCTLTGSNTCPPNTFAGGWWKADGSAFCNGPRYYIDCHTQCSCGAGCVPGVQSFCSPQCDPAQCDCHNGDCNNRVLGCKTFRYGQCHTEIACGGKIICRVVSCVPAYVLDSTCSTVSMSDPNTANHNAPCLEEPPNGLGLYGFTSPSGGSGAWLVGHDGGVFTFGNAPFLGSMGGVKLVQEVVAMASTPSGRGYWLVAHDGGVFAFGDAAFFGSAASLALFKPIVGLAPTPSGHGYWLIASDGGVFSFGNAGFHGSTGGLALIEPMIGMSPTPSGGGYWLVASDGGVFCFGDAKFFGSTGGRTIRGPVAGLVPTPSGMGYYLYGRDGSVYPFGDAPDLGSYASLVNPSPAVPGYLDAFVGMSVTTSLIQGVTTIVSYTLWAVTQIGPPPTAQAYNFSVA